ncbi:hypothetical protein P7C70_g1904, partial [Phenoliferia sp. Uapishka_3]
MQQRPPPLPAPNPYQHQAHLFPTMSPPPSHPSTLLPAPALFPTQTRFRKRSAQGALDPIDEAGVDGSQWSQDLGHRRTTSLGRGDCGVGLGVTGMDESDGLEGDEALLGPRRKRPRFVDVEPAFANLSLATPRAPPTLHYTTAPPNSSISPPASAASSLPYSNPIPPGLLSPIPPLVPFLEKDGPSALPVTPPMQQGESYSPNQPLLGFPPPIIRTHRPTPTPSPPPISEREDARMSGQSSYEIAPNVVYVASLEDSDDELEEDNSEVEKAARLELHPAFLAAKGSHLPSPLPPELLTPKPSAEMGLVLYQPLKFGPADIEKREEEFREYKRKAGEEESKNSDGTIEADIVPADEDVEMDSMDVD